MTHRVVRVDFHCPYPEEHFLGSVGRQVIASAGTPPTGYEPFYGGRDGTLEDIRYPGGRKIRGHCAKCARQPDRRRTPELTWSKVQGHLDQAEQTPDGVLRVPMRW